MELHKNEDVKKLTNFSRAYSRLFYKEKARDLKTDIGSVAAQKIDGENEPLTEDVKDFLQATTDYIQEIQSDIDLYVALGKHNEASFRRKLDPIEKNVWRKENPLELVFKEISNFDAQTPVIGFLLREIASEKNTLSSFLEKAHLINDVVLRHRFERLKRKDQPLNKETMIMMTIVTTITMMVGLDRHHHLQGLIS